MTRAADKGKRAERELCALFATLAPEWNVTRTKAGWTEDAGDLDGLPATCAQVKFWNDAPAAQRAALHALPAQQRARGCPFAVAFIRQPRSGWVAVMTPEQFVALLREATNA